MTSAPVLIGLFCSAYSPERSISAAANRHQCKIRLLLQSLPPNLALSPSGNNRMTDKTNNSLTPVATQPGRLPVTQPGPSPVRVKLRRVNANLAKPYPPDGESKVWWKRLKKALGTKSSDFVNASLLELQAAANLPFGGISEVGMNVALALIEGVAPRNEIEGALAVQMACTHTAA